MSSVILGIMGRLTCEEVVLNLLKTRRVPILTFGFEASDLNKSAIKSSDFSANRFSVELFKTINAGIISE